MRPLVDDNEVDIAAGEQAEGEFWFALPRFDAQLRVLVAKPAQRRRHQGPRGGGERGGRARRLARSEGVPVLAYVLVLGLTDILRRGRIGA